LAVDDLISEAIKLMNQGQALSLVIGVIY